MIQIPRVKRMLRKVWLVRLILCFVLMTRYVCDVRVMLFPTVNTRSLEGGSSKKQVEVYLERRDDPYQWARLFVCQVHRVRFALKFRVHIALTKALQ